MVDIEAIRYSATGLRCQVVFGLCDVGSGFGCRGKNT